MGTNKNTGDLGSRPILRVKVDNKNYNKNYKQHFIKHHKDNILLSITRTTFYQASQGQHFIKHHKDNILSSTTRTTFYQASQGQQLQISNYFLELKL